MASSDSASPTGKFPLCCDGERSVTAGKSSLLERERERERREGRKSLSSGSLFPFPTSRSSAALCLGDELCDVVLRAGWRSFLAPAHRQQLFHAELALQVGVGWGCLESSNVICIRKGNTLIVGHGRGARAFQHMELAGGPGRWQARPSTFSAEGEQGKCDVRNARSGRSGPNTVSSVNGG